MMIFESLDSYALQWFKREQVGMIHIFLKLNSRSSLWLSNYILHQTHLCQRTYFQETEGPNLDLPLSARRMISFMTSVTNLDSIDPFTSHTGP